MLVRRLLVIGALVVGCSSPLASPTPVGNQPTPPRPTSSSELVLPSFPDETPVPTAADSGTRFRILNVSTLGAEDGPAVELRISGPDGVTLLTVAPGELSDFVSLPKGEFVDSPQRVTIVDAGAPAGTAGLSPNVSSGDIVTAIVYRHLVGGEYRAGLDMVFQLGEPQSSAPWPEIPDGSATLAIFAAPLAAVSDMTAISVRTKDGDCLVDTSGAEVKAFAGTGVTFITLPAGPLELLVASQPDLCVPIDPDIGRLTLDFSAGDRLGLVAWAPHGEIELITLDLAPHSQ